MLFPVVGDVVVWCVCLSLLVVVGCRCVLLFVAC